MCRALDHFLVKRVGDGNGWGAWLERHASSRVCRVSLGKSGRITRNGTVNMEALQLVSSHTGKLWSPMIAAPTMGIGDHSGNALAALTLKELEQHPGAWKLASLRARCSGIGGDGQVCAGGPDARSR